MSPDAPTYTAFKATPAETVFTPSTIIALVILVVVSVIAFGAILVTRVRRYRCRSQEHALGLNVDDSRSKEACLEAGGGREKLGSASFWARITRWSSACSSPEPEPELPWPVYAVLPHLRPKAPLHVRVLQMLGLRRRKEVKVSLSSIHQLTNNLTIGLGQREPLTVADVQRAKDEHEARERLKLANKHQEEVKETTGWWTRFFGPRRVEVPEIVIHPCDGSPAFSYMDEFVRPCLPCDLPPAVTAKSCSSPSPVVDATPNYSPESNYSPASTVSEPDSPMPATPDSDSAVYPVILPTHSSLDCLDVPMPATTSPKEAEEKPEVEVVNVSRSTGEAFVLGAPPKKSALEAARGRGTTASVGLGLWVCAIPPVFALGELSPSSSGSGSKCKESSASKSSSSSVPDIMSILDDISLDSSASSDKLSLPVSAGSREVLSVSGSSRKRFARILDVLNRESSVSNSGSTGSTGFGAVPNSRSTYYGILGAYSA